MKDLHMWASPNGCYVGATNVTHRSLHIHDYVSVSVLTDPVLDILHRLDRTSTIAFEQE